MGPRAGNSDQLHRFPFLSIGAFEGPAKSQDVSSKCSRQPSLDKTGVGDSSVPIVLKLWCSTPSQEEGGRYWQLSLNEIHNMMDNNSPQLVELLKLDTQRCSRSLVLICQCAAC